MAYFSNGSEGGLLDEQCGDCLINAQSIKHEGMMVYCPVHYIQMTYNYKQIGLRKRHKLLREVMNILVNEYGNCQMKVCIDANIKTGYIDGPDKDTAQKIIDGL